MIWPEGNPIFTQSIWLFGQNISKWVITKEFGGQLSFHNVYPPLLYCFYLLAFLTGCFLYVISLYNSITNFCLKSTKYRRGLYKKLKLSLGFWPKFWIKCAWGARVFAPKWKLETITNHENMRKLWNCIGANFWGQC